MILNSRAPTVGRVSLKTFGGPGLGAPNETDREKILRLVEILACSSAENTGRNCRELAFG